MAGIAHLPWPWGRLGPPFARAFADVNGPANDPANRYQTTLLFEGSNILGQYMLRG